MKIAPIGQDLEDFEPHGRDWVDEKAVELGGTDVSPATEGSHGKDPFLRVAVVRHGEESLFLDFGVAVVSHS